ncbi:AAA domain-containing protein [Gymnopilus junonius]|uniref:AAA domain-containing protein n=1 Tax=Gymnopilus junonius TaxID=109634 RepID=A0A9P5TLM0_GYMJU|nr:AAA domain-containing protein [Gymnopilus junonius]
MSSFPTGSDEVEGSEFQMHSKIVLILCGLIASGKSTFAEALQQHYPQFCRCNQDDLGDRRRVEQLAIETLNQGLSVCVDRTNFNAMQRSYWIDIAREFPGTAVWVIVFDTPYEVCAARLQTRTFHPTITSPELGMSVLSRFAADFEHPAPHEGYERILYVKPSDHPFPVYTRSDITSILQRVQNTPLIVSDTPLGRPGSGYSSFRGNSYRGRRGVWGENSRPNYRVSRGSFFPEPHNLRGSTSTPYRGMPGGLRGSGRGLLPRSGGEALDPSSGTEINRQGAGAGEDPIVID